MHIDLGVSMDGHDDKQTLGSENYELFSCYTEQFSILSGMQALPCSLHLAGL